MATPLEPYDSIEIKEKIASVLESNLTDPYEQRKSTTRTNLVEYGDWNLTGVFPKIHVDLANFEPTKINSTTKSNYLEEEEHTFMIYYYNQRDKRFEFADGTTQANENQVMKYLQYIRNTLKSNIAEFSGYFHNMQFGNIPKPTWDTKTNCYVSAIPVTVFTYRR